MKQRAAGRACCQALALPLCPPDLIPPMSLATATLHTDCRLGDPRSCGRLTRLREGCYTPSSPSFNRLLQVRTMHALDHKNILRFFAWWVAEASAMLGWVRLLCWK